MGPRNYFCQALFLSILLIGPHGRADGIYGHAGLGFQQISQNDINDAFTVAGFPKPSFSAAYPIRTEFTAGYRFWFPLGVELSVTTFDGRDDWETYTTGGVPQSKLEINEPYENTYFVNVAPVLCLDQGDLLFLDNVSHQFGLRLGEVYTKGTASATSYVGGTNGSFDYSGDSYGWGIFYRLYGHIIAPNVVVGMELGYQSLEIPSLQISNASGRYAGSNGQTWANASTGNVYRDQSGPYLQLIVGVSDLFGHQTRTGDKTPGVYERLRSKKISNSMKLFRGGQKLARAGDNNAAENALKRAVRYDANNGPAWQLLGDLLKQDGDAKGAKNCYAKSAALRSNAADQNSDPDQ